MSILDDLTKKVSTTAKAVSKKSGDIVEVTKLNMAIGTEEEKIQKAYFEMGKAVYDAYTKNEEIDGASKEIYEKIKTYESNIKELKDKVLEHKSLKVCPSCNTELDIEIAFCPKCGTKQEIPQPKEETEVVEEAPKDRACPICGLANSPDAAFCSKCGAKFS